jgi:hypothetical protein
MQGLLKSAKISVSLGAQADGQATVQGATLDMQGFDGVLFLAKFDDVDDTSVITLKAQEGGQSDMSDAAELTDGNATFTAGAADADDKLLGLDVYRPLKRYIRAESVIGTANATLAAIIAIQYKGRIEPVTQSADLINSLSLISPS